MTEQIIIAIIVGVFGLLNTLILVLVKKLSKDVDGHMTELLKLKKEEGKTEQKEIDKK